MEKPVFVVFAGPNGSGKSSTIKKALSVGSMPELYINADDIAKNQLDMEKIKNVDQKQLDQINLAAAQKADQLRKEAISSKISFATETVMSTPAKIELMREAKAKGYHVHLIYVTTQDPQINIERVCDRVAKGGHNVLPEKTAMRYERAMRLLPAAIQAADTAKILNNSFENPICIMKKEHDKIQVYPRNPPDIRSKWTFEKLQLIAAQVATIENRFKDIRMAPNIQALGCNPLSDRLYDAYAKAALTKNENVWMQSLDTEIMRNMLIDGKSTQKIKAAMTNSPEMITRKTIDGKALINDNISRLMKDPEIKKSMKSKGMER